MTENAKIKKIVIQKSDFWNDEDPQQGSYNDPDPNLYSETTTAKAAKAWKRIENWDKSTGASRLAWYLWWKHDMMNEQNVDDERPREFSLS